MKTRSIYHRVRHLSTFRHRVLTPPWPRISNSLRTRYIKTTRTRSNVSTPRSAIPIHTSSMLALPQQVHHQLCKTRPTTRKILPVDRHPRRNESQPSLPHHFLQRPLNSRSWRKVLHRPTMFPVLALLKTTIAWLHPPSSRIPRTSARDFPRHRVLHPRPLRLYQPSICKIQCRPRLCIRCRQGNNNKE